MLFNSIDYLVFLPTVFIFYWFLFKNNFKAQNFLILISSYIFYGLWDWRFLTLILLSTIVDYIVGSHIYRARSTKIRKIHLGISIFFNLGLLGFFKYFNFFIESWIDLLSLVGYQNNYNWSLKIILPVGISFYTFQTMSYSLDIYFKKLKPTKDFISFASFVAFFPQLVAGPIERASNLLPQILAPRIFSYQRATEGLRLILWGLFKKTVIADSLAWRVDYSFTNYQNLDGGSLLLGLVYFSLQIYCDFSGYSDIAIGSAKLLGIELISNFKFPYFSKSISEFWKSWHISLSNWFKDYVYIPLGGSKNTKLKTIRNIYATFILSGFWHGANWTFIIWGLTHATLYIPSVIIGKKCKSNIPNTNKYQTRKNIRALIQILFTFLLVTVTWVFFRSDSLATSIEYLFFTISKLSLPSDNKGGVPIILIFLISEWLIKKDERNPLSFNNLYLRQSIYYILIGMIYLKIGTEQEFIYFQF